MFILNFRQAIFISLILINLLYKIDINFLIFIYSKPEFLVLILFFLLFHFLTLFILLLDLIIVDTLIVFHRFCISLVLLSFEFSSKLILFSKLNDFEKLISNEFFFKNANWMEREGWDLFGLFFDYNQDLRRILTDYGFVGFPLRKDFPLSGYFEVSFSDLITRIRKRLVTFSQELRSFFFIKLW
jgi:NADH:ubiquinone oxidoreductase subunit C